MKNAPDKARSVLDSKDTSAATQRNQIIALLKEHQSLNTLELRGYGFMAPATRIFELRAQGYVIPTVSETYIDQAGKTHRNVARYYLSSQPSKQE
ncbi:helix-turn-helix domain-containing protein [Alteromonas sp. RKMC-009]|uniref:helix-turn-helix domain-containing protein n=1 Tax=Alteromonas sp. RKMC-009 TaxID=2267264 RepID=UPI000E697F3E|nr:helix-turn-helix domain-containing protein [Alteromonas sp. RKMC-009]AYA64176.1 hypothetical protein DS731_09330 [Alteromonas sp. RKMC-009]